MCVDLIRGAKEKNLKVKGPVRMPTKVRESVLGRRWKMIVGEKMEKLENIN